MMESSTTLPRLTAEQRRAAIGQFDRAKQVLKGGDHDYGLQLLLACCKIDPANLIYRQELRHTQRGKYKNNGIGQALAAARSLLSRFRLRSAMMRGQYLEALHQAELILMRNPWDLSTHLAMSLVFEELNLPDHALWTLEQIRPNHPKDPKVNRPLARLYEKRGNFNQAIALWDLVRQANPGDIEAQHKGKDLAASATIAKGRYEDAVKGEAPTPLAQDEAETSDDQPALDDAPAATATPAEVRSPREVSAAKERIKNDPKNANGYLQLAGVYRRADQFDEAREVLQQGLGPTGNNFEIGMELLDLEIEPFRRDLAITEERLRANRQDAILEQIRQKLAKEINTLELHYFRRRSDRHPTDSAARFEMGLRLVRAGQIDEAIKELQAIRNDPRWHGKALFYLGFCFKARKNWRLALRNFEEALPHLINRDEILYKEAMFNLAVGYAETGELQRAIDLGNDLAHLDYNYQNIGKLLDEWQTKSMK